MINVASGAFIPVATDARRISAVFAHVKTSRSTSEVSTNAFTDVFTA